MRIACLADSLHDDLAVDDLGDADLAAVEHADHRADELARPRRRGMTSRQSSPASNNWVTCFA